MLSLRGTVLQIDVLLFGEENGILICINLHFSMPTEDNLLHHDLVKQLTYVISETNGIGLDDTLELAERADYTDNPRVIELISEFRHLLSDFQQFHHQGGIDPLLQHPVGLALESFLGAFPLPYRDEHIHLTGSMRPEFVYKKLKPLLEGPNKAIYEEKIRTIYGNQALPISSAADVEKLMVTTPGDSFDRYLDLIFLPKLVLVDRETHREAAYDMAKHLYEKYNVGHVRLKFTLSRQTSISKEQIPGIEKLTSEDVVLGLYDGFSDFQAEQPQFTFTLSPLFRKEADFYDTTRFQSKEADFLSQVNGLLELLEKYPELKPVLTDVDTAGNERELYRKSHFAPMKKGFDKLHVYGFKIRSHHGEVWHTLNKGIQAVDNALNIWHIDTLEHGISLGINPNYYFHSIYLEVMTQNEKGVALDPASPEGKEVMEMDWSKYTDIQDALLAGKKLTEAELTRFAKVKFATAREVEYYQHDVLNRIIQKHVSLTALPSSNYKLTRHVSDFKDHPFSWWEKKGLKQAIGTDNYITLGTNMLREMLILLLSDPRNLKLTKLLMVATGEYRRPYLSKLLWDMRKAIAAQKTTA